MPTGPAIVLAGLAVVIACVLLAPGRGVIWRAGKLARDRRRTLTEGVLVDIETAIHAGPPPSEEEIALSSGRPRRALPKALRELDRTGKLTRDGDRRSQDCRGVRSRRLNSRSPEIQPGDRAA